MSALVEGCYDLVPIPDAKLGPRKLDVASSYNTERYRPIYANKRWLPIFLKGNKRNSDRSPADAHEMYPPAKMQLKLCGCKDKDASRTSS